ncbi:hypothetical protein Z043_124364 [Scleropages formosus]|uniref:non-specific serine/threonine protein kinase n=1 Tax=Scleropages formosus TaxID=113540 RepID=A0A0P7W5J8_SCLFO|nr:hypothetical protein Z043_124364 [Scleropages formosus]
MNTSSKQLRGAVKPKSPELSDLASGSRSSTAGGCSSSGLRCGETRVQGPLRVLGVSFLSGRAARVNWEERLAIPRRNIGLWKARSLSFLGKIISRINLVIWRTMGQCVSEPHSSEIHEWSGRAAQSRRRAAVALRRLWGRLVGGTRRDPRGDRAPGVCDTLTLAVPAEEPGGPCLHAEPSSARSWELGHETAVVHGQDHCENWGTGVQRSAQLRPQPVDLIPEDREATNIVATMHPVETTRRARATESPCDREVPRSEKTRPMLESGSQKPKDKDGGRPGKGLDDTQPPRTLSRIQIHVPVHCPYSVRHQRNPLIRPKVTSDFMRSSSAVYANILLMEALLYELLLEVRHVSCALGLLEGRYTHGPLLYESSFGPVYEGIRTTDGLQVAIKYVSKEESRVLDVSVCKEPLPLEVAIMMHVNRPPVSPHILNAVECFELPADFALVMERPDTFQEVLEFCEGRGQLREDRLRTVMLQVIKALRHCQDRGVLYGVLDFRNVLIRPDTLAVKLIVYGCRRLDEDKDFAGKELHLPPEVFLRNEYLPTAATVWSFGVTLYALAFGQPPFSKIGDIITWNLAVLPGVSDECLSLMTWCLRPKATNRPTLEQIELHPWFRCSCRSRRRLGLQDVRSSSLRGVSEGAAEGEMCENQL